MASPQADALTEAHRQAQAQIATVTALGMLRLWPALGNAEDEAATGRWLVLALQLIRTQRVRSANLAGNYLTRYRELELPRIPPFAVVPAVDFNEERVTTSLMVTGPQAIRGELQKRAKIQAKARAEDENVTLPTRGIAIPALRARELAVESAGAAVRHVRDGARDTASGVIRSDKRVLGYTRVTSGDPCFWCAMLASRGPVYQEDSFDESNARFFGPGNARAHDHCSCDLRPLYSRTGEDTGQWKQYEDIWIEATRRAPAEKVTPLVMFRRIYEGRA